ncbi:MAG TPA: hypothetical protein PLW76_01195 [Clostridia bacterium]|nr:hypothetical protein [Clostridia bacterium]
MAEKNSKTKKSGELQLKLLQKLILAPENRNEPSKGAYPKGRFGMFKDILFGNFSNLAMANILTLIFALPLIALICFVLVIGFENFSYMLNGVKEPYLLSDFGIGLSRGASLIATKANMLIAYRVFFSAIAVCLPILGFGIAGLLYLCTKYVWGESFICKKDKYGNDVPRIIIEYFRGVKLYWKQTVIIMAGFAVIFAGVSNLIILFVEGLWTGLNAGHVIGLIAACIIGLASVMVLFNLLPMVVAYDMPLGKKLTNAAILATAFFLPSLIILILAAAPFLLTAVGGILNIFVAIAISMIGFSYFCLISVNYLGYNSEKILVPLYEASINPNKSKKKSKKSKSNKQ